MISTRANAARAWSMPGICCCKNHRRRGGAGRQQQRGGGCADCWRRWQSKTARSSSRAPTGRDRRRLPRAGCDEAVRRGAGRGGATNRVHLRDYEAALSEPTGVVMRAHRSNFKIIGFTEEPDLKDIVDVTHKAGVVVVDDLGSGSFIDTAKYGLVHEPTVQEILSAGVDIVTFSGDKLLGGPQAGIIVGRADLIAKIKKHPLARAVRADKVALAGITATLLHYLKDEAEREIPIWQMISMEREQVKARAEAWRGALGQGEVVGSKSTVGGGSLPGESLKTWVLALDVKSPDKFMAKLRLSNPPLIARTENNRILLDPRTVLLEQDEKLLSILKSLLPE